MPYIEAKLSIELNDSQKDELQAKLANAVSSAFANPFKSHFIWLLQAVKLTCGTYAEPYLYGYSGGGVGK